MSALNINSCLVYFQVSTSPISMMLLQKRRQTTPKEDVANHGLTQDFIEQQRAYFAEIDAFDLPEEEVASIDDLD